MPKTTKGSKRHKKSKAKTKSKTKQKYSRRQKKQSGGAEHLGKINSAITNRVIERQEEFQEKMRLRQNQQQSLQAQPGQVSLALQEQIINKLFGKSGK